MPHAGPGTLLRAIAADGAWHLQDYARKRLVVWPGGDASQARDLLHSPARDIAVSRDGRWIAVADNQNGEEIVRVRATDDPSAEVRRIAMGGNRTLCLSPDSRWLLVSNRSQVRSWSLPELEPGPVWSIQTDQDQARSLVFSPDGRLLATTAARNVVELRDAATFELLIALEAPTEFQRCAWSADGTELYLLDVAGVETRVFCWRLGPLRARLAAVGLDW